jgi:hypothetical protein
MPLVQKDDNNIFGAICWHIGPLHKSMQIDFLIVGRGGGGVREVLECAYEDLEAKFSI